MFNFSSLYALSKSEDQLSVYRPKVPSKCRYNARSALLLLS